MKKLGWLLLMLLVLTACRGTTAIPSTTPSFAANYGISLAGVAFEVHQEPG
ncbi:MAG: hypothetical protein HKP01_03835 [Gemmatimonadetes bacterium]|nr:hypothetical protein [Gemmatimonadota bacterium]